jgi:hypothetical protein
VYIAKTADGSMTCIWDTDRLRGFKGGGCNDSRDFFAGRPFVMSLAYDGGPSVEKVSDARIVGVVTDRVARVEVLNSAGEATAVQLTTDRAFAHVVPVNELQRGISPVAVIAYGSDGSELDRQTTGIGTG